MISTLIHQIALAALVGAMQQAIQHWFPWKLVFGRNLHRVVAYIIGTLGYLVPLTVLFAHWDMAALYVPRYVHLAAVWSCVLASGLAVLFTRAVDAVAALVWSAKEARQRELEALSGLRGVLDEQE
jgi:hypothetical protein